MCVHEILQAIDNADMEHKGEIKVRCELGFLNVNISTSDIYHQLGAFYGGNIFHQH